MHQNVYYGMTFSATCVHLYTLIFDCFTVLNLFFKPVTKLLQRNFKLTIYWFCTFLAQRGIFLSQLRTGLFDSPLMTKWHMYLLLHHPLLHCDSACTMQHICYSWPMFFLCRIYQFHALLVVACYNYTLFSIRLLSLPQFTICFHRS
jgi:hypothetical protein